MKKYSRPQIMVLNQWFPQNTGTATDIAMAFSGIGGAVCNPLCAKRINIMGWCWAPFCCQPLHPS